MEIYVMEPGEHKQQGEGNPLRREHQNDLEKSGLSAEMIARMGCFSATAQEISKWVGSKSKSAGYGIPYADVNDQTGAPYCRYRLSKPIGSQKYQSGFGDDPELYVPPGFMELHGEQILVVTEGEKKAAKAVQEGISCVAVQGVWSWADPCARAAEKAEGLPTSCETPPLARLIELAETYHNVLILGDSDLLSNPGARAGFEALERSLLKRKINVSLAYCPPGAETEQKASGSIQATKQGLDDWLTRNKSGLVRKALRTMFYSSPILRENAADSFVARHFAEAYRRTLSHSSGRGWMRFTGTHWEHDRANQRVTLVDEYARSLQEWSDHLRSMSATVLQPFGGKELDRLSEEVATWAGHVEAIANITAIASAKLRKRRTIDDILTLAQPRLTVSDDIWDRDRHLLAVQNGIVDLRNGTISACDPTHYNTLCAKVEYDPAAKAVYWDAYLRRVQPSPEVRLELKAFAGYCATGETKEQAFFMHWGQGGNGKSTFQQTIKAALGTYATVASPMLVDARADRREASHAMADLAGKRLAIASELEQGVPLATALIKRLTGEETVNARHLYQSSFCFTPVCKLLIDTNHLPKVSDTTHSFTRRLRTTEWKETISIEELEHDGRLLRERLLQELKGVLAWIVEGAVAYYTGGLPVREAAQRAEDRFCESADLLRQFIDSDLEEDIETKIQSAVAFAMYKAFLTRQGRPCNLTTQSFSQEMEKMGYRKTKDRAGCMAWAGLRARNVLGMNATSGGSL